MNAQLAARHGFSTLISGDYVSLDGLRSSTGQSPHNLANVIYKELIDNALDACESVGIVPEITIGYELIDDKTMRLSVSDNGAGLDAEIIEKILDFSTRTSTNAVYKSPTRGAQGNAFKTILCIPTAFGGGLVTIESKGLRHEISVESTPTGDAEVIHNETDIEPTSGTAIIVTMPLVETWYRPNPREWVQKFAIFNPHSFVSFEGFKNKISTQIYSIEPAITYKRLGDCSKITPNKPINAHSFTDNDFYTLAYATAKQANKPIGEFIRQFDGLKSTTKAKVIASETTGAARFVSDIVEHRETVTALHSAMKSASKPIEAKHLGAIGETYLLARLNDVANHKYKKIEGFIDGVPYVFEVLIADCNDTGGAIYGVNHSPTYDDFLGGYTITIDKFKGDGIHGLVNSVIGSTKHTVICHLIGIGLKFKDKGKTSLDVPDDVLFAIGGLVIQVAKSVKRGSSVVKLDGEKEPTFKAACFDVLNNAIALATDNDKTPMSVRGVYYKVRELVQSFKTKPLVYDTFTDILTQFWAINGRNKKVYSDARGLMYEPHSGVFLPLGSMEVDGYIFPPFQFDKILFIEKKGLWHTVKSVGLHQKYDMAVIASEGFATVAIRDLLDRAQTSEKMTIFALHDADPAGYEIARTLQEATRTMPNHNIIVIDLGLFVQDALDIGIEPETFERTNKLSKELNLNAIERELFEGVAAKNDKGKPCFKCKRMELNALTASQLVDYIDNGIARAIAENGLTNKVIPPETVLSETAADLRTDKLKQLAMNALIEKYGIKEKVNQFVESMTFDDQLFTGDVGGYLISNELETWRDGLNDLTDNQIAANQTMIDDLIVNL